MINRESRWTIQRSSRWASNYDQSQEARLIFASWLHSSQMWTKALMQDHFIHCSTTQSKFLFNSSSPRSQVHPLYHPITQNSVNIVSSGRIVSSVSSVTNCSMVWPPSLMVFFYWAIDEMKMPSEMEEALLTSSLTPKTPPTPQTPETPKTPPTPPTPKTPNP